MTPYKLAANELLRRGDVMLVRFPFTDQSTTKQRPAVVVSGLGYNQKRPDVVVMAITSQVGGADSFGQAAIQDWQDAGLLKASILKPIIATLEQSLLIGRLGVLSERDQTSLAVLCDSIFFESGKPANPTFFKP
jgi:mRNA interferase MazF